MPLHPLGQHEGPESSAPAAGHRLLAVLCRKELIPSPSKGGHGLLIVEPTPGRDVLPLEYVTRYFWLLVLFMASLDNGPLSGVTH